MLLIVLCFSLIAFVVTFFLVKKKRDRALFAFGVSFVAVFISSFSLLYASVALAAFIGMQYGLTKTHKEKVAVFNIVVMQLLISFVFFIDQGWNLAAIFNSILMQLTVAFSFFAFHKGTFSILSSVGDDIRSCLNFSKIFC